MLDTSARLLALLTRLQARPSWTGTELAEELGVSVRTIRNDIAKLRALDYPVEAERGAAGHYRLGHGTRLPPLVLDDDEAVAVAVGLRAAHSPPGTEEDAARALAKLEQVLPNRLRRRVAAIGEAVSRGPQNTSTDAEDPVVPAARLAAVADAIRDRERLRFRHAGVARAVEPSRLVSWERRWFLVARDASTGERGVFRLDQIEPSSHVGPRFEERPLRPGEADDTEFVVREVASTGWKVHARLRIAAPAADVVARINPAVGVVEELDAETSVLVTGADSLWTVAVYIGMLGIDFTVEDPPELREHIALLADRYARAAVAPKPRG